MKRVLALCAVAMFALAGCSRTEIEIIAADELPPDIYQGGRSDPQRPTDVILYMVQGNHLVRVARTGRASGTPAEIAVRALLLGPSAEELTKGIVTRILEGTELVGIEVDSGVASVNLNGSWLVVQDPNDPQEYILRMAQLVWTLDEIPEVTSVRLLIDGEPRAVLDQDKRTVTGPVARGRYSQFEPRSGQPVSESEIEID